MKRLVLGSAVAAALMWTGSGLRAQVPDAGQAAPDAAPPSEAPADPAPADPATDVPEPSAEVPNQPQPAAGDPAVPGEPLPSETQPAETLDQRSEEALEDRRDDLRDDREERREDLLDDREERAEDLREDREEFREDRQDLREERREDRMERREAHREQTDNSDNRWRYRQHNGRWWYYLPEGSWTVWIDGAWVRYNTEDFSSGGRHYVPRSSNYRYGSDYGYNPGVRVYVDDGYGDYGYGYGRSNRYRSGFRGLGGYGDYDRSYGYGGYGRGYGRGGYRDGGSFSVGPRGFGFSYGW